MHNGIRVAQIGDLVGLNSVKETAPLIPEVDGRRLAAVGRL